MLVLRCVWLFATPWTVAHQTPLSMGFPGQEQWSGLPFPPPGDRTCISCTANRILCHLSLLGSHFVSAAAAAAKSLQSCPTLCDPIDGSSPGSPVYIYLILKRIQWDEYLYGEYDYLHFPNEENKAQRSYEAFPRVTQLISDGAWVWTQSFWPLSQKGTKKGWKEGKKKKERKLERKVGWKEGHLRTEHSSDILFWDSTRQRSRTQWCLNETCPEGVKERSLGLSFP